MFDGRHTPLAHTDLKAALETVVAENWKSKALAQCLLSELYELQAEDVCGWLINKLDEFELLLSALKVRFLGHPPMFAKIGLKITTGTEAKRLERKQK